MSDLVQAQLDYLSAELADLRSQLAPLQRMEINSTRKRLSANLTLYVRLDGSDANDGLANVSARAFASIQKAVDVACQDYESGSASITIQVQDGTWGLSSTLVIGSHRVGGGITLQGNVASPSACILRGDTAGMWLTLFQHPAPTPWYIKGFRLVANTGLNINLMMVRWRAHVVCSDLEFGASGTGAQIYAFQSGHVWLQAAYSIVGSAAYHMLAAQFGEIEGSAITVTITGTPTLNIFAVSDMGYVYCPSVTFSGAVNATGKQYEANNLGQVRGTFPGGVAGTTSGNGVKT